MPASRTPQSRHTLCPSQFERLAATLSEANKRQAAIAAAARAVKSCTHHARTRAQKLRLAVNVKDAAACPQRFVAAIPLPVLDRSICAPPPAVKLARAPGRPKLSLVGPRPPADAPFSGGPYNTISLSAEPIPSAVAPTTLRAWPVPMPRFLPDDSIFTVAPRRAPEPPVIPVIPDVPLDEAEADAFFEAQKLGYPRSGAADYAEASSLSESSSSAGSSSTGPVTPPDVEMSIDTTLSKRRRDPEQVVDKRPRVVPFSFLGAADIDVLPVRT